MNKLLIVSLAVVLSGCACKGYITKYDYSDRDSARMAYREYLEDKYKDSPCWYLAMSNDEKKKLKKVRKIDPVRSVEVSVKVKGLGNKKVKFDENTSIENESSLDLTMPDFVPATTG